MISLKYSIYFEWEGDGVYGVRIVDDLQQLSLLLMFLSTCIFYRYLKKVRRERKLTGFEWTMYFVTQFATLIWAFTYFIKHLAES